MFFIITIIVVGLDHMTMMSLVSHSLFKYSRKKKQTTVSSIQSVCIRMIFLCSV